MEVKIIKTDDGSHSLYVPELKETYHSFHGAIQESNYVFINNGLLYWIKLNPQKPVNILEVGFGTGLNVLLTFTEAIHKNLNIFITTLEPFPLDTSIIEKLNYGHLLKERKPFISVNYREVFKKIHQAPWKEIIQLSPKVLLQKQKSTLENIPEERDKYDLVFFDAFAPNKQPELWTVDILKKTYRLMREGGILITYCAQGQFKRNLKMAGFTIETIPGPPGKKEMVRAAKI